MQVLKIAVLVAFLFAATVKAGTEQLAAILPSCAVGSMTFPSAHKDAEPANNMKLECMASSMSQASCAAIDQKCLCTDAKYTGALEKCVLISCTIRQSLSMGAQPAFCFQSYPLIYQSYEKCHNVGLWSPDSRPNKGGFLCWSRGWCSSSDRLHSQNGGSFQVLWNIWNG